MFYKNNKNNIEGFYKIPHGFSLLNSEILELYRETYKNLKVYGLFFYYIN